MLYEVITPFLVDPIPFLCAMVYLGSGMPGKRGSGLDRVDADLGVGLAVAALHAETLAPLLLEHQSYNFV